VSLSMEGWIGPDFEPIFIVRVILPWSLRTEVCFKSYYLKFKQVYRKEYSLSINENN
jgi:hypothetical protein